MFVNQQELNHMTQNTRVYVPKVQRCKNANQFYNILKAYLSVGSCWTGPIRNSCIVHALLTVLVNMNVAYPRCQRLITETVYIRLKEAQNIINMNDDDVDHIMPVYNKMLKIEKIMSRRAATLPHDAATKIQRAWRAHAYNPDRSTFGINLARREFDNASKNFKL
jgi:hypothetical protein